MKKQNKTQSGRSMIEMLAVISLMGMLSIGGIYGYRQVYNSYRVTALKDILLQGKAVIESNKRGATNRTLQLYAKKTSLNCPTQCVSFSEQQSDHRFKKTFHLYSKESIGVCKKLIDQKQDFEAFQIKISPSSCSGNEVTMDFSFDIIGR